jgi:lysozyme family protein
MTENRRFAECVAIVLGHEGGFADRPRAADPGGTTNYGITIGTLRDWRGADVTPEDVRNLTIEEARAIYFARYWTPIRGDDLPMGVDLAVFDWAVHGGPGRAARDLQAALGVTVDGAVGRQTIDAARAADPIAVIRDVNQRRLAHLRSRPHAAANPGWFPRVARLEDQARERASRAPLTMREAQRTDTVQVATQVATLAAPLAAGVPAAVQAFAGVPPVVGVALVVAGLVLVVAGAWVAASWLRARRT